METIPTIRYECYTKLPTNLLQKANQLSPILEIFTPHKGVVIVEINKVDKGIFRRATTIEKQTEEVIHEIRTIEKEARDYLLEKWVQEFNNPPSLL